MARTWIGPANYLFIPLVVEGLAGYDPPPPDYRSFVQRRVYFDPDPVTSEDRSLMSYINDISYGRASINATVSRPVTVTNPADEDNLTLLAIYAQPDAHRYEYLAVVYPPNQRQAGYGMSQPGQIAFNPPRNPNRTRARSRFRHDERLGAWAMEVLHNVTEIGDYYNGVQHPGRFDEMADSVATHPSTYTKLEAGWLDPGAVPVHLGDATASYTLHAVGLAHPAPGGRVAGIRVQAPGSSRYLILEARLKSDRWDRGFSGGSDGIPSEGVVVYEFAPENDPWAKQKPNGPWPPLELRTVLAVGQSFEHRDTASTSPGVKDHRTGPGRHRVVTVRSAVVGGFVIEVTADNGASIAPPHQPGDHRPPRPPGTSEP